MKKIAALTWLRWPLAVCGVLAAAALVWFVGPLIGIRGQTPLAGEPARWAAIVALGALVLLRMVWRHTRAAQRNRALMQGLVAAAPGDKEVAVVAERFAKAIALLKSSRIGGKRRGGWNAWAAALSGRPFVYELPWYVIIGAPGAGKTTALVNSGLQFPLASQVGDPVIRGIGGTRNCDWWFSSEAVLIDTAGRYTTQDSHQEADRTAWLGFLDLLARHRPRQPINGVLLTLSVSDLLNAKPEQRLAHAAALRERIEELHDRLGIAFPVYVLVTKTDLLAGFMEFFADFDKDERAQVWGATFPYQSDATRDGPQALLATEFAALDKRLNDCLIEQMSHGGQGDHERERRAAAHAFPQQWRVLRQTLFDFLQSTIGGLRSELRPMVRGVYFTSATQEGTPMDRALGGMARALGLPGLVLPPSRPSGKTFFVTRLLRDVVFAESGLARTNTRWRRRRRGLEWGVAGFCALAVASAAALSWRVVSHNEQRIGTLAARLPALEGEVAAAKSAPANDLIALLPALDAMSALSAGAADDGALSLPGLDRGLMLASVSDDAYLRTLRNAFQPRIAARLEARLKSGSRDHVALIYDTLKAYLMLFGGKHYDRAALRAYLVADWDASLKADAAQHEALRRHLDRLLASGELGAPDNADAQLVAQARTLVAGVPLAQRAYARLKQAELGADAVAFNVEAQAGAAARQMLTRASGKPLTHAVPALYSRAVFQQSLPARTLEVLRQFAREQDWVLGTSSATTDTAATSRALSAEVSSLYLADYAAQWQGFIGDLRLAPATTLAAQAELATLLSRPDSPLLALLRAIVRETSVVAGNDGFEALRQYVTGQPAPIDATQAALAKFAVQLAAVDEAAKRKALPPAGDAGKELGSTAQRAPEPVRGLLTTLAATSSGLVLAAVREPLSRQVSTEIGPHCGRVLAGRYPLQRNAAEDIPRAEFARAFGADGLFDAFMQRQLRPHLDALRAHGDAAESVQAFVRAASIRDTFFRDGGKQLGVRLEFRALDIDPGIGEFTLDIDGQVLRFKPGAPGAVQAVDWPGAGDSGRVHLQVTPTAGVAGPGFTFQGPWALFRLLDRVRTEPGATADKTILSFDVEGRKARFEVRSATGPNPISRQLLEQFQCPSRL
jgi:type VI secretion system protein ImpL